MKIFYRYGKMKTDEEKKVLISPSRDPKNEPKITIGGVRVGQEEKKLVLKTIMKNFWVKKLDDKRWFVVIDNRLYTIRIGNKWTIRNSSIESLTFVISGDIYEEESNLPEL